MPATTPTTRLWIVLVASLLVPSAVLDTIAWLSRQHAVEAANRQVATTVLLLREQMARVPQSDKLALDLVDQAVQGMAWEQIDHAPAVQARLEALLRELPQIASIALVAPDGHAANSDRPLPQGGLPGGLNVADRDYFTTLRDHPEIGTFVSRAYQGRVTHKLLFTIAQRRSAADGRFDGVIVLSVDPDYIGAFYGSFAGPKGMAILLARTDGAVLARYPPHPAPADLPADNPMLAAARESASGMLAGRSSIDDTVRLAGFARIPGYPLVISYGISRAGVLSQWRYELLIYAPLTATASLALAMMTWLAMRGAAQVAAARQGLELANRDLALQVAQRTQVEAELRELNAGLEQRVAERTSTLAALAKELEGERLHLATLIRATPFAELLVDQHGRIIVTNAAAEQLFGYPSDELIGQAVEMLVPERLRHGRQGLCGASFASAIARPMGAGLDVAARRKDGSERAVEVLLSPQQTPGGLMTIVGISDISARREAQAALQRINAELVIANHDLAAANAAVRLKNEEVEAFVYSVSHDLRAPLINLQGFANELERGCAALRETVEALHLPKPAQTRLIDLLDETAAGTLPYITASVTKFDRLIKALLELSRTGRYPLHPAPTEVAAVLRTTLDALRRPIEAPGAQVDVGALPPALADVTALGQIFANLITNAVKFTDPSRAPEIEIGGDIADGHARYWVRDNGIGIPLRVMPRLFQVFQRFHPEVAPGDGIGLATVRRLVERLGGTVRAESEAGIGSIFWFTLPAHLQETPP